MMDTVLLIKEIQLQMKRLKQNINCLKDEQTFLEIHIRLLLLPDKQGHLAEDG